MGDQGAPPPLPRRKAPALGRQWLPHPDEGRHAHEVKKRLRLHLCLLKLSSETLEDKTKCLSITIFLSC